MEVLARRKHTMLGVLASLILLAPMTYGCYNYVCSEQFKTCTKKSGDNVFINSNACASKFSNLLFFDINYNEC
jgi:hypothetical protein